MGSGKVVTRPAATSSPGEADGDADEDAGRAGEVVWAGKQVAGRSVFAGDFGGVLVVAEAEVGGVAEGAVGGPFAVGDLYDELGSRPVGPLRERSRQRRVEGISVSGQVGEETGEAADLGVGETGSDAAGVAQGASEVVVAE